MINKQSKSGREVALDVLSRFNPKKNYAGDILEKHLHKTDEKQRATDIVFGVVRNQTAIDNVVYKCADCVIERIEKRLLNIVRIGVYELVYCPKSAEYSVVNDACEIVRKKGGKKKVGFVNAVLRQIQRSIKNRQIELVKTEEKNTLLQDEEFGCEFNKEILCGSEENPGRYLSEAFSLPEWLVDGWIDEFGFEKASQICSASNRKPSLYIRVNTLKTTAIELKEEFERVDVNFEEAGEEFLKIVSGKSISSLPGFLEGKFSVQDITAGSVIKQMEVKNDWAIADICAAPGTKTMQLAEVTCGKAKIFATDKNMERLEKVVESRHRLGADSVEIVKYDELENVCNELDGFDVVLLDVPCSNTGVLAKRIEVRYRIKPDAINALAEIQTQLLEKAKKLLKPDGIICYSTCSIQRKENFEVIEKFLKDNLDFKLKKQKLTLPMAGKGDFDGGFFAVLEKQA